MQSKFSYTSSLFIFLWSLVSYGQIDSLKLNNIKAQNTQILDSTNIKTPLLLDMITYNAEDFVRINRKENKLYLYNKAELYYGDITLRSGIIILDYILGMIMWTLIGRAAMNIFQREDSTFFFMRVFVKYTNPIIKLFKFITPSFLFGGFIALYVAWFFYLFRFYAMPYLLGYDVWGMLAFPLESDFSKQLYRLFN